ncbi:unnamed protein product [Sphagnum jensenii]|jgi:DNA polymerase delta subunit 4|uniref:Uncharacterized protein n=2 Tax=Sphagnum jensenii TaxID=128206 RepID=A0ABP0WIE3_9BRYO
MATVRTVDSVFPKRKKANSASAAVDKSRCSLVLKKSKEAVVVENHEELSTSTTGFFRVAAAAALHRPAAALIASRSAEEQDDDDDDVEEILRQFDMNLAYGPCLGLSRLARWERARGIGLNPSQHVKDVLELCAGGDSECLWEGRV